MMITDDPLRDFERWDIEQGKLPELVGWCEFCGGEVFEDEDYITNCNGDAAHVECYEDAVRKVEAYE